MESPLRHTPLLSPRDAPSSRDLSCFVGALIGQIRSLCHCVSRAIRIAVAVAVALMAGLPEHSLARDSFMVTDPKSDKDAYSPYLDYSVPNSNVCVLTLAGHEEEIVKDTRKLGFRIGDKLFYVQSQRGQASPWEYQFEGNRLQYGLSGSHLLVATGLGKYDTLLFLFRYNANHVEFLDAAYLRAAYVEYGDEIKGELNACHLVDEPVEVPPPEGMYPNRMVARDLDGDENPDLIVHDARSGDLRYILEIRDDRLRVNWNYGIYAPYCRKLGAKYDDGRPIEAHYLCAYRSGTMTLQQIAEAGVGASDENRGYYPELAAHIAKLERWRTESEASAVSEHFVIKAYHHERSEP